MKTSNVAGKLFLLLAISAALAAAQFQLPQHFQQPVEPTRWQSSLAFDCGGLCLEGNVAAWQIQIQNLGDKEFDLTEVGLIDSQGIVFARRQVSEKLGRQGVATAVLQGLVPPPTRGWTLYYKACFLINNRTECEASDRLMLVTPLSAVECIANKSCRYDEQCLAFKCRPVACLENETAFNHSCTAKTVAQGEKIAQPLQPGFNQVAVYAALVLLLAVTAVNTYWLLKLRRTRGKAWMRLRK